MRHNLFIDGRGTGEVGLVIRVKRLAGKYPSVDQGVKVRIKVNISCGQGVFKDLLKHGNLKS